MNEHQGSIEELRPLLAQRLLAIRDRELRDEALVHLERELRRVPAPPAPAVDRTLNKSIGSDAYYAVRDSDLDLIEEAATITAEALLGLAEPLSLVGSLLALLYRYRAARIRLSGTQGLLLRALKAAQPAGLSLDELCREFHGSETTGRAELISTLDSLMNIHREGEPQSIALVEQHGDLWRSVGI